ncbi:MAG: RNA methyltransferase [Bacteroidales bacterium]|nr:RNA methyltransferase [Bacteroidales bacterium]
MTAQQYRSKPDSGLAVVLDNIRSAYNVGSIFRSSDAFGVDRIVLCGISAVPPSAEIHKSALGAEDAVRWEHCDSALEAVEALKAEGYTVVAVEQTVGSVSLADFDRKSGVRYAFVFGNEVDGVAQEVVDAADLAVEIPQYGTKHSLNVAVSAGAVLWEAVRKNR